LNFLGQAGPGRRTLPRNHWDLGCLPPGWASSSAGRPRLAFLRALQCGPGFLLRRKASRLPFWPWRLTSAEGAVQGASMKTAVGVCSSLDGAEQAIRALLKNQVPSERITFLTRSEPEASSMSKHLETEPGFEGQPARFGVISVPGLGPVLVQGPDVSDLFGQ